MRRAQPALHVLFIVIAAAMMSAAQDASPPSAAELLKLALHELIEEGEAALADERLGRGRADFAADFTRRHNNRAPDAKMIWNKLRRPVHQNDFVDAYVRWQLTGFDADLPTAPEFSDADFERLLAELPAMVRNPRSDPSLIQQVNRALAREELSDEDARTMEALNAELAERSRTANELNRPAIELRRWIEENAGATGHRVHQARLEHLASLVQSGWNAEGFKRRLTQGFEDAANDETFTPERRRRVAEQATKLAGLRTPMILRVGAPESAPQAEFDEAAVYDFEVNAWIRTLLGDGTL